MQIIAGAAGFNGGMTVTSRERVHLANLAADLGGADFDSATLRAAWGDAADDAIGRGVRSAALRAIRENDTALATLARLFLFALPQTVPAVTASLPHLGLAGLVELGLARIDHDTVVPERILRPQSFHDAAGAGEWWVISDIDELGAGGVALPENHVLGVGGASLTLAGLTLPTPASSLLDLGTGCGIQTLRGARFADRIVATDLSSRALDVAAQNLALNGLDGVELREGSLFEPVAHEQFERIVSNPPFVITPRLSGVPAYEYRDGGLVGDALVEQIVSSVGERLVTGGVAQMLGNWETVGGVRGLDRVARWVTDSAVDLDAWVIERDSLTPVQYAEMWIRDGGTAAGTAAYDDLMAAWLDDFAERGVTEIGFGYVLLRRTEHATLRRFEAVTGPIPAEATLGSHLARGLAAHDHLEALGDDGLLAAALTRPDDVTEVRHYRPGEADPSVIELRQNAGFGRSLSVDAGLAAIVGACEGELSLAQLIYAVAQLMDVDEAALRDQLLPEVRRLIVDGFLDLES